MGFDKNKFALAASGTMGIAYVICAAFTAFAPELALRFLGWMIHLINLEEAVAVNVTLPGFFGGLLPILFYSYLTAWVFAWLYNKLSRYKV